MNQDITIKVVEIATTNTYISERTSYYTYKDSNVIPHLPKHTIRLDPLMKIEMIFEVESANGQVKNHSIAYL